MNKWIGILIIILYFSNSFISDLIYPNICNEWFRLKYGILTFIVYLSLEYKPEDKFIEKVFNAIVLQNAYLLIFKTETTYSLDDLFFVCSFTAIQYLKHFQKEYLINLYNNLIRPDKK